MTARLTCPFCSTAFAPARPAAPGQWTVCPRCGESFAVSADAPGVAAGEPPAESPAASFRPFAAPALLGLTLFVTVFAIGTYAIFNGKTNRGPREPAVAPADDTPEAAAARRLDRDLGFLPPETNAVLTLRPGDAPGDLAQLLDALGIPPTAVTATLDKIGVTPDQVRSLTVGLAVPPDNPVPRAIAVLTLREVPSDARRILSGFGAKRDPNGPGDQRYQASVNGVPVALRVVDPRTYLLALDAREIDRPPTPGRDHLTPGLQLLLAACRAPDKSESWAVAVCAPEEWARMPLMTILGPLLKQPDLAARLAGVRSLFALVAAPPAGGDPGLLLSVTAADAPAAARLGEALAPAKVDGTTVTATRTGKSLFGGFAPRR